MNFKVIVGQVWSDRDARRKGRLMKVISVDATHAHCVVHMTRKKTKIRLDRFEYKRNRYSLIGELKNPEEFHVEMLALKLDLDDPPVSTVVDGSEPKKESH